jgi:hypothetical protein
MRRPTLIFAAIAVAAGSIIGGGFLWEEFANNNQGEYFDPVTRLIDILYTAEMFFVAAVPAALVVFTVLLLVRLAWRALS